MAVPGFVQHVQSSNLRGNPETVSTGNIHLHLPTPSGSGNCIVIYYFLDDTFTPVATATDDKGNTYVNLINGLDAQNNQHGILVATGITAGTQHITVNFTATTSPALEFASCHATEFYNVSTAAPATATDGSHFGSGTSSTVTAGSITPTQSGDLFVQAMTSGSDVRFSSATAGSQANITWALLGADRMDGSAVQWGVYNSTSAINPTMTVSSSSSTFGSVAVALKSAAAGTAPAGGIRINKVLHNSFWSSSASFPGPGYSNPQTIQIPCVGDSLLAVFVGGGNSKITSITGDSNGNTWTNIGTEASNSSTSQIFYVQGAVTSATQTITINFPNTLNDFTLLIYDISNGHPTAFFDVAATASGNQTPYAASIAGASITPTSNNGLVIGTLGVDLDTIIGVTGTGWSLDSIYADYERFDGPQNMDENNGWAHLYNAGTSAASPTFSIGLHTAAEGLWASLVASFKAAISGGIQATTTTPYIGLWSKDGVLAVGTFDVGIPIAYGLFDDGYVAQFSGTVHAANVNGVRAVPTCVFDRDADVIGMLGLF